MFHFQDRYEKRLYWTRAFYDQNSINNPPVDGRFKNYSFRSQNDYSHPFLMLLSVYFDFSSLNKIFLHKSRYSKNDLMYYWLSTHKECLDVLLVACTHQSKHLILHTSSEEIQLINEKSPNCFQRKTWEKLQKRENQCKNQIPGIIRENVRKTDRIRLFGRDKRYLFI